MADPRNPYLSSSTRASNAAARSAAESASKGGRYKPVKAFKEMLARDVATLENNPEALGLTEAERDAMVAKEQTAAGAQRQGQQAELARQALAGQEFQQGAFTEAQGEIAEQAQQTGAAAAARAEGLHQQMIARESARIRQQMDAARERARQNARFWAKFSVDSAGQIMDVAGQAKDIGAMGTGNTAEDVTTKG